MSILVWLAGLVGVLVAALVVIGVVMMLVGRSIPVEHEATSSVELGVAPERAWAAVADIAAQPSWAWGVTGVEKQPEARAGHERWRMRMGRNSFVVETSVSEPPRRLTRTIDDEHKHFSGAWEFLIEPTGSGCVVRLRELGRVPSPMARAIMKHFVG